MNILYDLFCAQPGERGTKFHGGGEYAKTVFEKLVSLKQNNTIIVFYDSEKFIDEWIKELIIANSIRHIYIKTYEDLREVFKVEVIDVYYSALPYSDISSIVPSDVLKVGTFHGLRGIEKPTDRYEYFYHRDYKSRIKAFIKPVFASRLKTSHIFSFAKALDSYDKIVCVSNHTLCAIKNYYSDLDKQVRVLYTPAKYVEDGKPAEKKPLVLGKYILLIGCNRWEKNSYRAILAINNMLDRGLLTDYKIITVGDLPNNIKKMVSRYKSYVSFGYVETDDLENLYFNCDIFLYPSLNEGFGMPPLEAMKYGKTCIVSGVCSLPEICGDAVYYCNPYDIGEIQNRLIMASECKIDPKIVRKQLLKIKSKQDDDLLELCKYIMEK